MSILLDVSELANKLSVSEATVYALCRDRQIRHVRIGNGRGAIRFTDEAVEEFVASRTVVPWAGRPIGEGSSIEPKLIPGPL